MNTALVAVAHGSRNPRSAAVATELVELVRARRPGLAVRLAFLDLSAPRLPDVLAGLAGTGHQSAVVVPLLLGRAYHARVDVPGALARAQRRHPALELRTADVLGPDERLAALARWRVIEAGGAAADAVVLAAAGCSDPQANAAVAEVAGGWAVPAFAAATSPPVEAVVAGLVARGARRVAVASWFLAPGLLPDRVRAAALAAHPGVVVAEPLGADPAVADVILDRYDAAARPHAHYHSA
ncbi:MAG: sirohydrochlorin chelatase [Actinomycetota bacterium]|nr:sirohydrochlorin chelatase [Actinomycetota bacterium]